MEKVMLLLDKNNLSSFTEGMLFRVIKKSGEALVSYSEKKHLTLPLSQVFSMPAYQKLTNRLEEITSNHNCGDEDDITLKDAMNYNLLTLEHPNNKPLIVLLNKGFSGWRNEEALEKIKNKFNDLFLICGQDIELNKLLEETAKYQEYESPELEEWDEYGLDKHLYKAVKFIDSTAEIIREYWSVPEYCFNDFGYRWYIGGELTES